MSKEMKVVVYRNYDPINWSDYSLIYEGTALINDTTTARDVFESLEIEMPLILYLCLKRLPNENYYPVTWFPFYYDEGILKGDYNPLEVKLSELNDYGYTFDRIVFFEDTIGIGMGACLGPEFIKGFYDVLNEFVKENPLAIEVFVLFLPWIKKVFEKTIYIIQDNLHTYGVVEQGIKFQKEYTLDSFTKALQLEKIRCFNNRMTYFQMVNAFLSVYGYKYDYKNKKWIKS